MSTPDAPVRPAAPSRRRFLRWLGATAVVLLTLAACGGVASRLATRPEPVGSPVSLSVADVYARAARALDRPGLLYHAMIRQEATPPYPGRELTEPRPVWRPGDTTQVWIDGHQGIARGDEGGAWIATTQGRFRMTPQGRFQQVRLQQSPVRTCPGASLPVAVLFSSTFLCTETFPGTIHHGQYKGRPALVLVTPEERSCSQKHRSCAGVIYRLYLEGDTALPLASETETARGGSDQPRRLWSTTRMVRTWSSKFIPGDAVPADFFDPEAPR